MGDRRMLTRKVTDDDHFINLSASAQALYLHLSMSADDDGFCNQVSICMFRAHASTQDLQALLDNRYLIEFDNGVIVIKHWRMANVLRKDRYKPTAYQEELSQLAVKENGAYTLKKEGGTDADWLPDGCQMVAERLPDGCQTGAKWLPQYNLSKDNISKGNLNKTQGKAGKPRTRVNKEEINLAVLSNLAEKGVVVNDGIYPAVVEWLKYKAEKGDTYTERGLQSLIKVINTHVERYGVSKVAALMEECAGNEYRGIIWDKIQKTEGRKASGDNGNIFLHMALEEGGGDDQTGNAFDFGDT